MLLSIKNLKKYYATQKAVDDISFDIAPTCLPPSNVEVTETLANGAEVTWDPIDNATNGYEWVVVLDGGDPTVSDDIIASGTSMTNSATIEGEGMESGVDYEVYVSTNCGDVDGESSFSQGVAFTTACVAPTGLTVDEIGLDEVTFSWDAMEASLGYEYIIVLTGEEPIEENYVAIGALGSSSQTSITVEFESYGPNVTFDIYFRIVCDTAFYGEWGMVSFTTPGTTAVGENTIEGFSYYPNPVKEQGLNLMAPQNIDAVIIYNMLGQEVLNLKPNAKNYNVEMSNLQAGTYILKVTVGSTTGTYGIIKE